MSTQSIRFSTMEEALVVRGLLLSYGVEAYVNEHVAHGVYGDVPVYFGGVEVRFLTEDYERVKSILTQRSAEIEDLGLDEDDVIEPAIRKDQWKSRILLFILVIGPIFFTIITSLFNRFRS